MGQVAQASATDTVAANRELVSTVVYLASLASETKAVDPLLDTLRNITSRWDTSAPLRPAEKQQLQQLVAQIKDYLVHRDPLRDFTPESLDARIRRNVSHAGQRRIWNFGTALLASVVLAGATVPIPYIASLPARVLVAPTFFYLFSLIGAAVFYITALRNFKQELHRAFFFICVGVVGIGVLLAHFIVLQLFDLVTLPVLRYGGIPVIVTFAIAALYGGLRNYARLLSINNWAVKLPIVGGLIVAAFMLGAAMTAVIHVQDPLYYGVSMVSLWGLAFLSACSASLAWAILRTVTAAYARSMRWLFVFLLGATAGAFIYMTAISIFGGLSGSVLSVVMAASGIIPVIILLYSGYSFNKETGQ